MKTKTATLDLTGRFTKDLVKRICELEQALAGYHDSVEDHTYLDRKANCKICSLLKGLP